MNHIEQMEIDLLNAARFGEGRKVFDLCLALLDAEAAAARFRAVDGNDLQHSKGQVAALEGFSARLKAIVEKPKGRKS